LLCIYLDMLYTCPFSSLSSCDFLSLLSLCLSFSTPFISLFIH
jgi:hypothetical protein